MFFWQSSNFHDGFVHEAMILVVYLVSFLFLVSFFKPFKLFFNEKSVKWNELMRGYSHGNLRGPPTPPMPRGTFPTRNSRPYFSGTINKPMGFLKSIGAGYVYFLGR